MQVPSVPSKDLTLGGPVYLTVGQHFTLNNSRDASLPNVSYAYSEAHTEYYYYEPPSVVKIEPGAGQTTGGTPIEVSGIWFDLKPQYGLIPHCQIGTKVVRATFHSTVRIVCHAPPNDDIFTPQRVSLSMNGVDFLDTGHSFSYYTDPEVASIFPRSGPVSGGSEVFVVGTRFSNITERERVKCRFALFDTLDHSHDRMPVEKTIAASFVNDTTMVCASPSGFVGGDRTYVSLTFNGNDYSEPSDNAIF